MTFTVNSRGFRGFAALFACIGMLMVLAIPAFAGSTGDAYTAPQSQPQGQVEGALQSDQTTPSPTAKTPSAANKPVAVKSSSNTLPFTGLELGLVLAVGAGLIVVGTGLRRITRASLS
jgi:hypothetical protein